MYTSDNITWIKNVKRNDGENWAYDDVSFDEPFVLHWPTSKKGSALTPKIGEIIVLFQKPKMINGVKNTKVHFTHLVTPIENDLTFVEENVKYQWGRKVKLVAKANPISTIPNSGDYNFFLPNRGLTNPIINLTHKFLNEEEKLKNIWELFNNFIGVSNHENVKIGAFGEIEGDKFIREHIKQEIARRNWRIVQLAKSNAMQKGNGKILCECCDFDFLEIYGVHGAGFIECHHKLHINQGPRKTTIEDLALVCSNCHRMLHRKNNSNSYFTVEELRELIKGNVIK